MDGNAVIVMDRALVYAWLGGVITDDEYTTAVELLDEVTDWVEED